MSFFILYLRSLDEEATRHMAARQWSRKSEFRQPAFSLRVCGVLAKEADQLRRGKEECARRSRHERADGARGRCGVERFESLFDGLEKRAHEHISWLAQQRRLSGRLGRHGGGGGSEGLHRCIAAVARGSEHRIRRRGRRAGTSQWRSAEYESLLVPVALSHVVRLVGAPTASLQPFTCKCARPDSSDLSRSRFHSLTYHCFGCVRSAVGCSVCFMCALRMLVSLSSTYRAYRTYWPCLWSHDCHDRVWNNYYWLQFLVSSSYFDYQTFSTRAN